MLALVGEPTWTKLPEENEHRLEVADARMRSLRPFNVPAQAWDEQARANLLLGGRQALEAEGIELVVVPDEA